MKYQLGSDITEIKQQLNEIKALLIEATPRTHCNCAEAVSPEISLVRSTSEENREDLWSGSHGRLDAGECECQRATLQIWNDGRYRYVSTHYNHSSWVDNGDKHRVSVRVFAGSEIIEEFGRSRFVPREEEREITIGGQSEVLRRRFGDITSFQTRLQCQT